LSADLEQSHEVALIQVGDEASGPQKGQVGLNHMAWMMDSLDDLKEFYQRLKDKQIPIEHVSDHGISVGIYFRDPDGNGIEVSYELPREQWLRQDHVFSGEGRMRGRFPGPWDEHLSEQQQLVAR
jgi:catechol 2,3-dioxygenase